MKVLCVAETSLRSAFRFDGVWKGEVCRTRKKVGCAEVAIIVFVALREVQAQSLPQKRGWSRLQPQSRPPSLLFHPLLVNSRPPMASKVEEVLLPEAFSVRLSICF